MIRTRIIPSSNNISVAIPDSYIGKKVEVILFTEEDTQDENKKKGEIKNYRGALSKETASELQKFAAQIRMEWDREI